jgi:ATPase subunit of ABC transporter with duplicated ATPase domains
LQKDFPAESIGALRNLAGAFQFSGDDIDKRIRHALGRREDALVMARMLLNPPNFLVLDEPNQPPRSRDQGDAARFAARLRRTMIFVSHDRAFLKGLSNRVLELGGESGTEAQPHVYPGTYEEYVARTGHEAPGVHH